MSTDARLENALLSPAIVQIAVITLSALAFGGVVYVAVMPFLSGERKASKRIATVAQGQGKSRVRVSAQPLQMRRKQVQDTIKDIEAKEKAKRRINLRTQTPSRGCVHLSTNLLYCELSWRYGRFPCCAANRLLADCVPTCRDCLRLWPASVRPFAHDEKASGQVSWRVCQFHRYHRAWHQIRTSACRLPANNCYRSLRSR